MLSKSKPFLFCASIPEDKPVKVGKIPFLVAEAIQTNELAQVAAEANIWDEIRRRVSQGEWAVRNPLDMGPHTFPHGQALKDAVLFPWEAVKWFEHWGVDLRFLPPGNGPEFWNLANAATAIANQEGWHIGARETLLEQMMQAVRDRVLTVRHPHTDQPYWPNVVRDFYELVTPADVNHWLALDPVSSLRWNTSEHAPSQSQLNMLDAVDREAQKRERQAEQAATGWYYLFEVSEYITRQRGINEVYSDRLLKSMIDAAGQESLKVFDEVHQTKLAKGEEIHSRRMTRREHVNAWLLADGVGYLWEAEQGHTLETAPVSYLTPKYSRLAPRNAWRGGLLADTDVVTLPDAARFASKHAGTEITPDDFLRAASNGLIQLCAIVHQRARVQAFDGGIFCNAGQSDENVVPAGSIATLPLAACQHLAAVGRASWRTFDGGEIINGERMLFTKGTLMQGEPDFETVPADCRVTGINVHALADAFADQAPEEPQDAKPGPAQATTPPEQPAWTFREPMRYQGYALPLSRVLKAAFIEGRTKPTAREVLERFRENSPLEVAKFFADSFDYYTADGETKNANLDAITEAIRRMTTAMPR